jgi:hypothetical protein
VRHDYLVSTEIEPFLQTTTTLMMTRTEYRVSYYQIFDSRYRVN